MKKWVFYITEWLTLFAEQRRALHCSGYRESPHTCTGSLWRSATSCRQDPWQVWILHLWDLWDEAVCRSSGKEPCFPATNQESDECNHDTISSIIDNCLFQTNGFIQFLDFRFRRHRRYPETGKLFIAAVDHVGDRCQVLPWGIDEKWDNRIGFLGNEAEMSNTVPYQWWMLTC